MALWLNAKLPSHAGITPLQLIIAEVVPVLNAVPDAFLTAWIALVVVRGAAGERVDRPIELMGEAAKRIPSIAICGAVFYLGVILGTILLIFPGILLAVRWSAAVPALVVEKRSVRQALGRSGDLTLGHRWPIFGLGLLAQLAILGVSLVAMKVLAGGAAFLPALNDPVARYIVLPLINSAGQIAMSAGSASIYLELINRKEGGPQGALLATFD